jgi:hypothetical protein
MPMAVLSAPRRLDLTGEPVPDPAAGEVLLRVAGCGVCASELDMWRGGAGVEYPRFPGHEVSGTVEAAGTTSYAGTATPSRRIEGFHAGDVRFTFIKDGGSDEHRGPVVIGE